MNLDPAAVVAPMTPPRTRTTRPGIVPTILLTTLSTAAVWLLAPDAAASLVPFSEITATGDYCRSCTFASHPRRTVDGNFSTLWHGTNDLEIGDVNILAYQFDRMVMLSAIGLFMMNRQEVWELGELDIQVSHDTTDGYGGTWSSIASLPGDTPDNIVEVQFAQVTTAWLRLQMTYQGRGALGFTPAFRLHEVQFLESEYSEIPIPPTPLLVGLGAAFIAWGRRRRRFDNPSRF